MATTDINLGQQHSEDTHQRPHPLRHSGLVSRSWFQSILSNKLRAPVVVESYSTQTQLTSEGFLSEMRFYTVKYNAGQGPSQECHLAVKFLPNDLMRRNLVLEENMAKREISSYKFFDSYKIVDICTKYGVDLPVPKVYYAGLNRDSMTLVLEDLNKQGYTMINPKEGLDFRQTKTAVETIAVIHAVARIYLEMYDYEEFSKYLSTPIDNSFLDSFIASGLRRLVSLYAGDPIAETFNNLIPRTVKLRTVPDGAVGTRETFIHGDFWSGQVMFSPDETKVKILDWQFTCMGNQVVDLVSMLLMSSQPTVFEDQLQEILDSYWSTYKSVLTSSSGVSDDLQTCDAFRDTVDSFWYLGFMMLVSSVETHLKESKITEERLRCVVAFVEEKGVLEKMLS